MDKARKKLEPLKTLTPFYRQRELLELLGISRVTLWTWRRANIFPAAVQLGPRTIGWSRDTVEAWLEQRPAA